MRESTKQAERRVLTALAIAAVAVAATPAMGDTTGAAAQTPPTVNSAPVSVPVTSTPPPTPGMPPAPGTAQPGAPVIPDVSSPAIVQPSAMSTSPAITLTLDQAIATALNNNSTIALSRERLYKARQQIKQAYAEGMPQISAGITDTYSSQSTFSAGGGASSPISLPGGGAIPVIVDQQGASGTFLGGGGGGTSFGMSNSPVNGGGTSPVTGGSFNTGAPATTSPAPSTGGSGTGSGSSQAAPPSSMIAIAGPNVQASPLPSTLRDYAAAQNATPSNVVGGAAPVPHASSGSGSGNSVTGHHNNYSERLTLTQAVDIFGLISTSLDVLRRTRDFYAIDLNRVTNELALTVKNDYFTVLRDQANVAADQEQVRSATENVRITTAKFNAGQAARYDVLTAQTTLANDTQTLISAQNQLAVDTAGLNSLIGLPVDQSLNLVTPTLPPLDQPIDLNTAVGTAFAQRPEIKQAENNIAIAKRLVRINQSTLWPSLSLSAQASHNGPPTPGITADDYSVTANLSVPVFDGGATQARVQSAESDVRSQTITRDQLRQNVLLEVRTAYLNTMSARSAVTAAQAGVDQGADAARLAEVRFRTGVGTFLDVINAEAQLATARTNLATAEFQYQTSLASLTRAEGGR